MTVIFRRQLPPMERLDCESEGCIFNASYEFSDPSGATLKVCVPHDLEVRQRCLAEKDEVIDVAYFSHYRKD